MQNIYTNWWFQPPEKYESITKVRLDHHPNYWGKQKKTWFQTTNQFFHLPSPRSSMICSGFPINRRRPKRSTRTKPGMYLRLELLAFRLKKWRISWDENKNLMVINGGYWEFYGDEWCFSVKMRILSGDIMGIGMKNGYLKSRNIY